jgi:hydroxylamine reductase (hybrid-cluster protein)
VPRQAVWDRLGLAPRGVDPSIVEAMHRTNMGVDHDYRNLVHGALKTALADGMLARQTLPASSAARTLVTSWAERRCSIM